MVEGLGGLEQRLEERSKRSSLTSLVWDDECDFTTPYREEEENLDGYESGSSYTTIGESDSRESTPRRTEEERAYMETSVRRQGDRLLRDMLQLRRDIEMDLSKEGPKAKEEQQQVHIWESGILAKSLLQGTVFNDLSDLESTPGLEVRHILFFYILVPSGWKGGGEHVEGEAGDDDPANKTRDGGRTSKGEVETEKVCQCSFSNREHVEQFQRCYKWK